MHLPRPMLIAALALPLAACGVAYGKEQVDSVATAPAVNTGKARNVILFIGDGMGISTITAARIYAGQKLGQTGEEYVLPFETFDNVALVKTYNSNAQVPDSAGTATAINSGVKTQIGFIGMGLEAKRGDCVSGKGHELPLIADQAKARGLAVGIVSTARITHATPAAVYAHSTDRDWESDAAIPESQRGLGCEDIARQLVETDFDVALGGGRAAFFGATKGGRRLDAEADLPEMWRARTGGSYVETAAAMVAAPLDKPLLGIFSPSHMTYTVDRTPETSEPTLTDMTMQAVTRLGQDPDGYYLMVEAGRIDHGHHEGKAGYALEEAVEFARAIQWAIDNTDPEETLILVTADHSHVFTIAGYPRRGNDILGLVVPPAGGGEDGGDTDGGPTLAADGKPYTTLGYANGPGAVPFDDEQGRPVPETGVKARQQALVPSGSETHGGEDVALFGKGPGAERVKGVIEQNVIYRIILAAFGWE